MDKKFLERHNLTESQKRFQRILEYVQDGGMKDLAEAGPDDQQGPPMSGGAPGADPMGGGMPGGDPMGGGMPGGDPMGGGMPGGDPSMGGGAPGGDPNAAGGASQGVENFNPQGPADPSMGGGMPDQQQGGEDEEVVDVDELVDAQDDTKVKVAKLDGKIDALIKMIDKFESDIDANNAHIDQLKQEFEKRNPTQVEKMTLRSKTGYPFAQSPDEYWNEKEKEGNYSPEDDNNGVGDERYAITKNDVDNITDWDSIYKSIGNGTFHQDLKGILNF